MKPQKECEQLLAEVFADPRAEALRRATMEAGIAAMRRRRRRITVSRLALLATAGLLAAFHVIPFPRRAHSLPSQPGPAATAPEYVAGTSVRLLKDEELLAFFKGRPVALFGEPGSQHLVVFDEATH